MTDGPRPVDLEIYEPSTLHPDLPDWAPIKPYRLKINGVEVLTPDYSPVVVEGLVDKHNCATATIKVFVRSLQVYHEDDTDQ